MVSTPRRRSLRFAFSLRTLFVVVTIFGVWLGWNLSIVRERKTLLAELERLSKVETEDGNRFTIFRYAGLESQEASHHDLESIDEYRYAAQMRISRVRRMLGDETCVALYFSADIDPRLIERTELAFPEAILNAVSADDPSKCASRDPLGWPAQIRRKSNTGTLFKTGLIEK